MQGAVTSYDQFVGCLRAVLSCRMAAWSTMLCLVGSQSILAPLGKAVFKGRRRRIQAASGRFCARLEGCVLTIYLGACCSN